MKSLLNKTLYLNNNKMYMKKCYCSTPSPTGEWIVENGKSYAKCKCGGKYETSLFENNTTEGNEKTIKNTSTGNNK